MFFIRKTRYCARLADAAGIERLAGLLQNLDQLGLREAVADAEVREALDFRECAQHDDIAAFADKLQGVWRIFEELVVGLVKHHDDVLRHDLHEPIDLLLGKKRAGGIVWICDEDLAGALRDGSRHGLQIVRVTQDRESRWSWRRKASP